MAFDSGYPFPLELAALTPQTMWSDTVVIMGGGSEQRNQNWNDARRRYDASTAQTLTLANLLIIQNHFNARRARTRTFALRDRSGFRASVETIGTGDGATTTFQATVASGDGGNAYGREIYLLESGTVSVFDNGSPVTEGAGAGKFSVPYSGATAGLFTFGTAPVAGHIITASFDYWVCVRYDLTEFPPAELFIWTSGTSGLVKGPSLPLIETRYPDEF